MTNDNGELIACRECGMPRDSGEYHPYAACLMFKACGNSDTVRANIDAVMLHGSETIPRPDSVDDGLSWNASDTEYHMSIHSNPDHYAWADFFIKTFPNCGADRDTMAGWFANAMMAKHDSITAMSQASGSGEELYRKCWPHQIVHCKECFPTDEPAKPKAEDGELIDQSLRCAYSYGSMKNKNARSLLEKLIKKTIAALSSSQSGVDDEPIRKILKRYANAAIRDARFKQCHLDLFYDMANDIEQALGGGNE